MELDTRAVTLLNALIEKYISEGQPIGSRTLARAAGLSLSPATIRNVMADLEEMGLLASPHTSAGRVPTQLGYRLFVDTLLRSESLIQPSSLQNYLAVLEEELSSDLDPQNLIESTSRLLSEVTHLAGVVMIPRRDENIALKQIEFLALSGNRVLVILVTDDGQVHNRIIDTDRTYSAAELVQAANYFNDTYVGTALSNIKQRLLQDMQQDSERMHTAMSMAIYMAKNIFDEESEHDDLFVSGESNLLEIPELSDVNKLRRLFEAFNTKRDLLHLLDQTARVGGIKIFIGTESGYESLEECSVVTAPYSAEGEIVGTLGVVGPTRMAYEFVIPIVDVTARLISSALNADRN